MHTAPTLLDILIGLLPLVLVVGVWALVQQRLLKHMRRQSEALERIATALDKRA